jgi:lambda family phage portal protein
MLDRVRHFIAQKIYNRSFKAARRTRLESDWITSCIKTNDDLKKDLATLILRSRDLAKNHSDYIKWLGMRETNVVGDKGIKLLMKVKNPDGRPDKKASEQIEFHYTRWGKKRNGFCTIDQAMDSTEIDILVDKTVAVDGSCFIRIIEGADNPYLFSLQFIDSMEIDINYNVEYPPPGQNRIIMGIELDNKDRAVAFYRKREEKGGYFAAGYERIPAKEMLHIYHINFVGQVRGYPLSSGAILDMNMAEGYKETALVGARVAAAQMGIWTPDKNASMTKYDPDGPDEATEAPPEVDVTPGKIIRGKKGWTFTAFNPSQPVANFGPFLKNIYQSIANGLGVLYNTFRNDLESVNFSSLRAGSLTERDRWKMEQRFLVASFCEVIFARWLRMFLLSGENKNLPFSKYEKFLADNWQPRRWQWVDPRADATANKTKLEMKVTSRRRICAELGDDIVDIFDELEEEEKEMEKRRLTDAALLDKLVAKSTESKVQNEKTKKIKTAA